MKYFLIIALASIITFGLTYATGKGESIPDKKYNLSLTISEWTVRSSAISFAKQALWKSDESVKNVIYIDSVLSSLMKEMYEQVQLSYLKDQQPPVQKTDTPTTQKHKP